MRGRVRRARAAWPAGTGLGCSSSYCAASHLEEHAETSQALEGDPDLRRVNRMPPVTTADPGDGEAQQLGAIVEHGPERQEHVVEQIWIS